MRILTIDYETYWDIDYTLSKMTTEAYVRDPRFKAHMVGVKNGDAETVVVPGHQVQAVFDRIPWHDTAVLCQHAHFDGLIMSHHYGAHPLMFLDTLSMFRHLYPTEACSLANICKVLGLREKGGGYYDIVNTKGLVELSTAEYKKCAWYCGLDCDLTKEIFDILKRQFTVQELKLVNMTVKMFTNPILELNQELLLEAREDEIVAKAALMERVAHDKESLASNPKFAHILMSLGLDPPKKISPAALKNGKVHMDLVGEAPIGLLPDKKAITSYEAEHGEEHPYKYWAYAFGKADEAFKKLLEHDNPDIQAIIEARLGVKSTIKGTRTERLISISTRGTLPIYLLYAGAHTLRWSGGDKINPQNFNRGSKIRESIMAPAGHVIVVRDLSAIEARVLAWVAGQEDSVETFRQGIDIYLQMISSIVGRTVTKDEKDLRFVGKAIVLGAGYGLGWRKFQSMLRIGMLGDTGRILGRDIADPLGVNLEGFMHRYAGYVSESLPLGADIHAHALHCACAEAIIRAFRDNKPMIPRFWDTCQVAFAHILDGTEFSFGTGGIITTTKEGLQFPTGMLLRYTELECKQEPGKKRKEYSILKKKRSGERGKLYGGLCCENIVQRLARDIIAANMVTVGSRYHIATMTHDEIVCVVPESQAQECYDYMGVVMATPPAWAPGLPLASEGGFARNYSK